MPSFHGTFVAIDSNRGLSEIASEIAVRLGACMRFIRKDRRASRDGGCALFSEYFFLGHEVEFSHNQSMDCFDFHLANEASYSALTTGEDIRAIGMKKMSRCIAALLRSINGTNVSVNEHPEVHDEFVWVIDSKTYVYASTTIEEMAAWLSQLVFCNSRFNVTTPPGAAKIHLQLETDLFGHRIELYEPEDWSTPCLRITPAPWLFDLFTPEEKARVRTFCVRDYLRVLLRGHPWLTVASDLTGAAESG